MGHSPALSSGGLGATSNRLLTEEGMRRLRRVWGARLVSAVRVTVIRTVEPAGTTLGPIGFHCGKPEPYKTEKVIAHGPAFLPTQHGRVQGVVAVGQPYVTTSRSDQPHRQLVHAR